MEARSVVAILITITICAAILAPIVYRMFGNTNDKLSDAAISGLVDLIKVALGALIGWLSASGN